MTDLLFPKGLYPLATPTPMKRGDAARGVVCKSCSVNLPMMADPKGVRFVGDGTLLISCRFCLEQIEYSVSELIEMIVEEESTTPSRLEPSGIYRRPLNEAYPNTRPTFGGNFVELRPQAAIIIARCITLWPEVEAACAALLVQFIGHESKAAMSVFLAIRSSRTQFEAMVAAAQVVLSERDLRLFNALMYLKDRIEKERNRLAHGHFGFVPKIEKGLIWASIEDRAHSHVNINAETLTRISSKTYVYEPEDLETIAQEIEQLTKTIGQFSAHLSWPEGNKRADRFQQLCAFPHVAEALSHLDDRESSRAKQRARPPSRPTK